MFDCYLLFLVVTQAYIIEVHNEHVVLGNDVLINCKIPSLVSDQLEIVAWVDSQGEEYLPHKLVKTSSL